MDIQSSPTPENLDQLKALVKSIEQEAEQRIRKTMVSYAKARQIAQTGDIITYLDSEGKVVTFQVSGVSYDAVRSLRYEPMVRYSGLGMKKNSELLLNRPSNIRGCGLMEVKTVRRPDGAVTEYCDGKAVGSHPSSDVSPSTKN